LYDSRHFWDPDGAAIKFPGFIWLPNGPYNWEIETVARIFNLHQYQEYENAELEPGFEKIAIYHNEYSPDCPVSHVARQQSDGTWTSKLGPDEDIEHNSPVALEGNTLFFPNAYGKVALIMRRMRQ
jgi:hypothetical protein